MKLFGTILEKGPRWRSFYYHCRTSAGNVTESWDSIMDTKFYKIFLNDHGLDHLSAATFERILQYTAIYRQLFTGKCPRKNTISALNCYEILPGVLTLHAAFLSNSLENGGL